MFSKIFLTSLAIFAAANPTPNAASSQCDTGDVQCCNTVTSASNPAAASILNSIGVVVQGVDVLVGLGCTAVTAIGVGGGTCNTQEVCCTNNEFEGLINIGCSPISL